jgi:S-DNA-T family DNA segregation ATPase FtsK/SpoIIIE
MPHALIGRIESVRAERILGLPTLSASALSTSQGVNSNEDTHNARARHKPPARLLCTQHHADDRDHIRHGRRWSVMDPFTIAAVIAAAGGLGVVVWVLAKLGKALIKIAEALVAAAAVFFTLWLVIRAVLWALRQTIIHWRTSLTVIGVLAWWQCWGWATLATTTGVVAGVLAGWRVVELRSFDAWAGRHLRAWWLRWTVYAPKLPGWLYACGLGVKHDTTPVMLAVTPLARALGRNRHPLPAQLPKVLGVRSGASWDEVRVRLVPGQKPEDFDDASRALASARAVTRCQVREQSPNVVSIDFQRRNLLADPVSCPDLATLAGLDGGSVDLRRVWAGRTEYGQDWHIPLAGGHT